MWIVFSVQFNGKLSVCLCACELCVRVWVMGATLAIFEQHTRSNSMMLSSAYVRTSPNGCWVRTHCISLHGCGTESIPYGLWVHTALHLTASRSLGWLSQKYSLAAALIRLFLVLSLDRPSYFLDFYKVFTHVSPNWIGIHCWRLCCILWWSPIFFLRLVFIRNFRAFIGFILCAVAFISFFQFCYRVYMRVFL